MSTAPPSDEARSTALELADQARAALRTGERDRADLLVGQALELAADCVPAIELRGVLAGMRGDLEAAAEAFERVTAHQPDSAPAWFNLGKCCFDAGRIDDATAHLDRALALEPEMADALALKGVVLASRGDIDGAVAALEAAVAARPDHLAAVTALAGQLEQQGNRDGALAAFRRAADIEPGVPHTHYNLGEALLRRGQLAEASEALHLALTIDHNFHDARLALSEVARMRGDLDEAIGLCRRVVRKRPESLGAVHGMVRLLVQAKRPAELETLLDQAAQAHAQTPWPAYWRARLDALRGRGDAARTALKQLRNQACPPLPAEELDQALAQLNGTESPTGDPNGE